MVLICFEGPSGAGKTTLINAMRTQLDLRLWRRPPELEKHKEEGLNWRMFVLTEMSLLTAVDWTRNTLVVDRHPVISECIYSRIRTGKRWATVEDYILLYITPGTVFVYCRSKEASEQQELYDQLFLELSSRGVSVLVLEWKPVYKRLKELLKFLEGKI